MSEASHARQEGILYYGPLLSRGSEVLDQYQIYEWNLSICLSYTYIIAGLGTKIATISITYPQLFDFLIFSWFIEHVKHLIACFQLETVFFVIKLLFLVKNVIYARLTCLNILLKEAS